MTSHEQDERGQTLLGNTVLIPEELSFLRGRSEGRSQGLRGTLGKALPCSVRETVSLLFSCHPTCSPLPLSSLCPSQSSILQRAHHFQLHTFMLDREEGPMLAASRESHTTVPSTCPYLI